MRVHLKKYQLINFDRLINFVKMLDPLK